MDEKRKTWTQKEMEEQQNVRKLMGTSRSISGF